MSRNHAQGISTRRGDKGTGGLLGQGDKEKLSPSRPVALSPCLKSAQSPSRKNRGDALGLDIRGDVQLDLGRCSDLTPAQCKRAPGRCIRLRPAENKAHNSPVNYEGRVTSDKLRRHAVQDRGRNPVLAEAWSGDGVAFGDEKMPLPMRPLFEKTGQGAARRKR